MIEIILLETIHKLGEMGDKVRVKEGYARNYLLPQAKAMQANAANLLEFEARRDELEKAAKDSLTKATVRAKAIEKLEVITLSVRVSSADKLYGSVGVLDIVKAVNNVGIALSKSEVCMPDGAIHNLGEYVIDLQLDNEVNTAIRIQIVPEK